MDEQRVLGKLAADLGNYVPQELKDSLVICRVVTVPNLTADDYLPYLST
jgi:hypothetical protein